MAVTDGPAAAVRYVGISLGTLSSIASSKSAANDLGPFFVATAPRVVLFRFQHRPPHNF